MYIRVQSFWCFAPPLSSKRSIQGNDQYCTHTVLGTAGNVQKEKCGSHGARASERGDKGRLYPFLSLTWFASKDYLTVCPCPVLCLFSDVHVRHPRLSVCQLATAKLVSLRWATPPAVFFFFFFLQLFAG